MIPLAIARVNVIRLLRDRTGLFFIFVLPVMIIVVLGLMYGGSGVPRLGLVGGDGALAGELVAAIRSGEINVQIVERPSATDLREAVEQGTLEIGLVIPPDYDDAVRGGRTASLTVLGRQTSTLSVLRRAVDAAVASQSSRLRAARLAETRGAARWDDALRIARDAEGRLGAIRVTATRVAEGPFPSNAQPFSFGAQGQLILFMFLTSMTAATQLMLTRQLGVARRMLATPTPVRAIVVGETLGRFGVAMVQGLFIVFVSSLVFGVGWGEPLGAAAVIVSFALVGTGAAMAIGVLASNVDQAGTMGVFAGMTLGALGGAMVPLAIFDEPLRTLAHVTPHAWALDAFDTLVYRGGGPMDVIRDVAILLGYATVFMTLAVSQFRRRMAT